MKNGSILISMKFSWEPRDGDQNRMRIQISESLIELDGNKLIVGAVLASAIKITPDLEDLLRIVDNINKVSKIDETMSVDGESLKIATHITIDGLDLQK